MLKGKAAVVTGSTSGIGLAMAEALAGAGADVMLNGFGDSGEIERIRAGLEAKAGVRVRYDAADMTKPDEIAALIDRTTAAFGKVDILVNNAGIQFTAKVEEFPRDRWDAIIATNLSAAFHATAAVLPQMKARNWGRIVNVASTHGLVASVEKVAYVAAKHGVVGMTKVVALETAETGVTCNAICPGWTLTPLVQKQIDARAQQEGIPVDEAKLQLVAEKQPSKAFVTPEQLAGLLLFICSPAADQMRGSAVTLDGGWTAQ